MPQEPIHSTPTHHTDTSGFTKRPASGIMNDYSPLIGPCVIERLIPPNGHAIDFASSGFTLTIELTPTESTVLEIAPRDLITSTNIPFVLLKNAKLQYHSNNDHQIAWSGYTFED